MCESIGHRPLRGRCPAPSLNFNHKLLQQGTGTADHLTLLRLFPFFFPLFALFKSPPLSISSTFLLKSHSTPRVDDPPWAKVYFVSNLFFSSLRLFLLLFSALAPSFHLSIISPSIFHFGPFPSPLHHIAILLLRFSCLNFSHGNLS